MGAKEEIESGQAVLGLEFGSTRIKGVLIDDSFAPIASGSFSWENQLTDGIWSYPLDEIIKGLEACYASLKKDVSGKYGLTLKSVKAIGISGMMHGYLALDKNQKLLVPFRTWRNTITGQAAKELTDLLGFNIPERWTVAHLYQAILNHEGHVGKIAYLTTLSGYIQLRLTGRKEVGVGEASGIFPIDPETCTYDKRMMDKFASLLEPYKFSWKPLEILPEVKKAGEECGTLTLEGAALLDPEGDLASGIPLCPPEGDAGTGMAATNAVLPKTGNVSAGTSVFAMVVLEKPLKHVHPEIDVVATPVGKPVAMVHCNNCCGELDNWVRLFQEASGICGKEVSLSDMYWLLYSKALEGDKDLSGLEACNYLSGESITGLKEGEPFFAHKFGAKMNIANFMKTQLYSSLATLSLGMDILGKEENVRIERMAGQGGFFSVKNVGPRVMAAALKSPISLTETAGEGGPWGMAILASYMVSRKKNQALEDFLANSVFKKAKVTYVYPSKDDLESFALFTSRYQHTLTVERAAVGPEIIISDDSELLALKKRVWQANLQLVKDGLVVLTWGNVSAIDRRRGIVVIKPSGVDYQKMRPEDMTVVDLDGHVLNSSLRPSSDTPTHLELYKAFKEIGGITHTHSVNAVAFAQAGRSLRAYGTTHADAFYGDVPLTRELTEEEISQNYEKNTGKVIIEAFKGLDPTAIPAVLVKNHGPFTWGPTPEKAVENALILEVDAEMALKTEMLNPQAPRVSQDLMDKHYSRKHGTQAYYGQGKKND
jgi:L-ribulose-5-phosphate 4-epimerase